MKRMMAWMAAGCVTAVMAGAAEPVAAGAPAPAASTNAPALKPQETCPIMGGKINRSKFVDQDGTRIYVCCGGCLARLKKDFAAIKAKLEKDGIALEKTPAPVAPRQE